MNARGRTRRLAVACLVFLAGCGAVRRMVTGLRNDDLEGRAAPALTATAWIAPGGRAASAAPPAGEWTLLAFFLPD